MASKTFMTISKKECLEVYKEILANSEKKWQSGQKLAEIEDYGNAISMAIISVEELIKAQIVFLDGKGFEIRSAKGIKTLFENHQIRYLLAYAMFAVSIFGDDLITFLTPYRKNPTGLIDFYESAKAKPAKFERKVLYYAARKAVILKREFQWFSKVDIFRQDGFYCDYDEQLKNPININREDYLEVYKRFEKIRTVGLQFIEAFDMQELHLQKPIRDLQIQCKQNKYYEKLGESLSNLKMSRETPFAYLSNKMQK